ncbi:hypothetical protein P7K49_011791 [Saguinus oedipus]|uniref:Uncharacterized protein n=1 Tax=Saguinus oedipus TaxID=9490 RepID=A0ABQ9VT64_SAGOE|nr:hypothetical protein P7K49_011791 [Saguinus oedipus]
MGREEGREGGSRTWSPPLTAGDFNSTKPSSGLHSAATKLPLARIHTGGPRGRSLPLLLPSPGPPLSQALYALLRQQLPEILPAPAQPLGLRRRAIRQKELVFLPALGWAGPRRAAPEHASRRNLHCRRLGFGLALRLHPAAACSCARCHSPPTTGAPRCPSARRSVPPRQPRPFPRPLCALLTVPGTRPDAEPRSSARRLLEYECSHVLPPLCSPALLNPHRPGWQGGQKGSEKGERRDTRGQFAIPSGSSPGFNGQGREALATSARHERLFEAGVPAPPRGPLRRRPLGGAIARPAAAEYCKWDPASWLPTPFTLRLLSHQSDPECLALGSNSKAPAPPPPASPFYLGACADSVSAPDAGGRKWGRDLARMGAEPPPVTDSLTARPGPSLLSRSGGREGGGAGFPAGGAEPALEKEKEKGGRGVPGTEQGQPDPGGRPGKVRPALGVSAPGGGRKLTFLAGFAGASISPLLPSSSRPFFHPPRLYLGAWPARLLPPLCSPGTFRGAGEPARPQALPRAPSALGVPLGWAWDIWELRGSRLGPQACEDLMPQDFGNKLAATEKLT